MKTKRFSMAAVLFCLTVCLCLAGCGNGKKDNKETTNGAETHESASDQNGGTTDKNNGQTSAETNGSDSSTGATNGAGINGTNGAETNGTGGVLDDVGDDVSKAMDDMGSDLSRGLEDATE
ncbi:MAG: hypothetical protein HFI67_06610 [Lachnospiraceae bacterium]|nr:hypothetical protein [Lachnospiraceae bacterium]